MTTLLLSAWWVPFVLTTGAVWAAIAWPVASREHAGRGHALAAVSLLAVAIVTPLSFIAGPHPDPRLVIDPDTIAFPVWGRGC